MFVVMVSVYVRINIKGSRENTQHVDADGCFLINKSEIADRYFHFGRHAELRRLGESGVSVWCGVAWFLTYTKLSSCTIAAQCKTGLGFISRRPTRFTTPMSLGECCFRFQISQAALQITESKGGLPRGGLWEVLAWVEAALTTCTNLWIFHWLPYRTLQMTSLYDYLSFHILSYGSKSA